MKVEWQNKRNYLQSVRRGHVRIYEMVGICGAIESSDQLDYVTETLIEVVDHLCGEFLAAYLEQWVFQYT